MIRKREIEAVAFHRKKHAQELRLAERMLNAAFAMATNTTVQHPRGDARAGRVMLGLYGKILNNLLSIIVLTERRLPTASVMRELTEALANLAFIAKDPSRLSQLYLDGIVLRAERDISRRKRLEGEDSISPDDEKALREHIAKIEAIRGPDELKEMRSWGNAWAEGKTVEQMVQAAQLPAIVYSGAYTTDSRPVHAMDAADYLDLDESGNLVLLIPGRTKNHLMPAMAATLYAMELVNKTFALGRMGTIEALNGEVMELSQKSGRAAPGATDTPRT